MSNEIKIGVRTLIEYVFRRGSIDAKIKSSKALTEGIKVHQQVQGNYQEFDQKEVYLKTKMKYEEIVYIIDGRCDGLLLSTQVPIIEEIKSTSNDLSLITEETYPEHWAQAKCYAYMYAKEHENIDVDVQLTYVQTDTGEQLHFKKRFSHQQLADFMLNMIQVYTPYATMLLQHKKDRDKSIKELNFPFDSYREGQRKLAGAVYKTILESNNLFAKAPTGIGKTISTIFPTVKAIEEGFTQRILYLTAKTITRQVAEETFQRLHENGLLLKVVTITAKEKICFKEKMQCQKEYCEFANGYYDRVNDAILDISDHHQGLNRQVIEEYAMKHTVCPFELSLDVAYTTADAIICDYNYVYDPRVTLRRYFDEQKRQTVLLVDEAHNLIDRAREMFSATLYKSTFLQLTREYKEVNKEIYQAAKRVNEYFLRLKKQSSQGSFVLKEIQKELIALIEGFITAAEEELFSPRLVENNTTLVDAYFVALDFIATAKLYDERYITYIEVEKSEVRFKMFCLDPSHLIEEKGKRFRAKIFFSATLTPLDFYQDMLGGKVEDYALSLPSPFERKQTEVFIQPLSTRYRERETTKGKIATTLHSLVTNRPGNYLFFFPSYQYMNIVYEEYHQIDQQAQVMVQDKVMGEQERESFLAAFKDDNQATLVGFAVLGGIFSEGIDLRGNRLNGVAVIGVGLPQLCLERDLIKDYYNSVGKIGYDYAYVIPGMNKVLQAGGRLIRTDTDAGTIVLIDDRFLQQKYQSLLPYEWKHYKVIR